MKTESLERVLSLMLALAKFVTCVLVAMLAACSTARLDAPAAEQTSKLQVLGLSNTRFWIDEGPDAIMREMMLSVAREQAATSSVTSDRNAAPVQFLALSGGADDGAFGAGLLIG